MGLRIVLIAGLILLAVYVLRRVGPRIAADPRLRYMLSGVGWQMLRVVLLRQGLVLLMRAIRMLRFFR